MLSITRRDALAITGASALGVGVSAIAVNQTRGDAKLLRLCREWNDADRALGEYSDVMEARWMETLPFRPPNPFLPDDDPAQIQWGVERAALEERFGVPPMRAEWNRLRSELHTKRMAVCDQTPQTVDGVAAVLRAEFCLPPHLGDDNCAQIARDNDEEAVWSAIAALEAMEASS